MEKVNIPKIKKQEIWYHYIGEEIGKTKCFCCSINNITQLEFHCGHIIAKSLGGELSLDNLRPICSKCNLSMGNENMIDFMTRLKYNTKRILQNQTTNSNSNLNLESNKIHVWSEDDDFNIYLCYRFPDKFDSKKIADKLKIPFDSVKIKLSNYKSLENPNNNLSNYSKQSIDIFNKYKNQCIEQILNKPLEIKFVLRQNQWGVSKNVYDTIKLTKILICPWGHSKNICELFDKGEFNDKKFSKIFINQIDINDYVMIVDRNYKTGLIVKILSKPKTKTIDDIVILKRNKFCTHIPVTCGEECNECGSNVISVFTKQYLKSNPDEFLDYYNEDYHFERMYSIVRDIEIIGELPNNNEVYQKYKSLQSSICSIKDVNIDTNQINFI